MASFAKNAGRTWTWPRASWLPPLPAPEKWFTTRQWQNWRQPCAIQDSLPYIEPPAWYFSIRHLLGAELLADGQAENGRGRLPQGPEPYPANGWSLFGLAQALEAQDKTDEAATVRSEFEDAWSGSDMV